MAEVYMILCDGECDQIVDDLLFAKREKADLEKLGCTVRIRIFRDTNETGAWERAHAYESKLRGY